MPQEAQRIEFTELGPYLLPVFTEDPEGSLLKEQGVVVLQFGDVYLPVTLVACAEIVEALTALADVAVAPSTGDAIALDFAQGVQLELPLLTAVTGSATQTDNVVAVEVAFGQARAQLNMSIKTAAMTGTLLSQVSSA